MNKLLYYDKSNEWRCNSDGTRNISKFKVAYNESPTLVYNVFSSGTTPDPLTGVVAAEWVIANDFKNDGVMCRTLNADIDLSGIASGLVSVPTDTFKAEFLAVVTGRQYTPAYMRLKLLDAAGKTVFTILDEIQAVMDIDPGGGSVLTVPANTYTQAQIDAFILSCQPKESFSASVSLKTAQSNVLFIVPAGKLFRPTHTEIITTAITGPATLPTFHFLAGATSLFAARLSENTGAVYGADIDELGGATYYPAGTIFYMEITVAGTSTTHTGKALIKGVMADA